MDFNIKIDILIIIEGNLKQRLTGGPFHAKIEAEVGGLMHQRSQGTSEIASNFQKLRKSREVSSPKEFSVNMPPNTLVSDS